MTKTLIGIFLDTVSRYDKPAQFLRKRDGAWESISARHARDQAERLALGLRDLGVQRGDHVAILSETRYEWALADLALLSLGAVTVPIYPTLTAAQCRFILENADASLAVVSTARQLDIVLGFAAGLRSLRGIVSMEPLARPDPRVTTLDALLERGDRARAASPGAYREQVERVRPEDLATIIYTSGTTGEPKGALLTHGNIAFDVESCLAVIGLGPNDTSLSFLPLSHILERMAGLYAMLQGGVTIAFAQGFETVAADARDVKPTVLIGVPRFYEKVHARVLENAATFPPLRKRIFDWGMARCLKRARNQFEGRPHDGLASRLADRLVAAKIRERVGGRLRFCVSGGAPLPSSVMEFFFAIGIPILEGYGLTETSPVICLNVPGKEKPGSVGPPIPGVEVRIGDEGEILTRGPHVMKGYFKNEEATRAALRDGWFHTGDVGHVDAEGRLVITDRLKDLIVTAGGKKVAPQPLENRLKSTPWIAEAVLIGDRKPYVACLLVPNYEHLEQEARVRGWTAASRKELLDRPEVTALYHEEIEKLNRDLAQFERIKRFALLENELTQETGELTPTLKVRRRVVSQKFADVIERLYSGESAPAAA